MTVKEFQKLNDNPYNLYLIDGVHAIFYRQVRAIDTHKEVKSYSKWPTGGYLVHVKKEVSYDTSNNI